MDIKNKKGKYCILKLFAFIELSWLALFTCTRQPRDIMSIETEACREEHVLLEKNVDINFLEIIHLIFYSFPIF